MLLRKSAHTKWSIVQVAFVKNVAKVGENMINCKTKTLLVNASRVIHILTTSKMLSMLSSNSNEWCAPNILTA
jgi:hypothetical protein